MMIERHLLKLRARDEISAAEEQAIRSIALHIREIPAGYTFISRGQELSYSTLILDGFACRYKDLAEGQRQITELHVPGDFADLHSFTLKRLDHSMMTITSCRVATVSHESLRVITEMHPHLTRVYWRSTNIDAAIHREWELSLGRRSAIARMANLFCELYIRLEMVGLVDGFSFDFNLTQAELADCLGLTNVHVNRTLRDLRETGCVDHRRGVVEISDFDALAKIAEFDPMYLYLDRRPV